MSKAHRWLASVSVALLAAAFVASGVPAAAADSGWTIQSLPTPAVAPNGELTGVSCTSPTACIAVGTAYDSTGRDVALAEGWNGARWEGQSTPRSAGSVGASLAAVSCTAANACTAVGNGLNGANAHEALAERWNGREWQIQSTLDPATQSDSFLSGVACTSAVLCIAVGSHRDGAGLRLTLAERWNGRTWQIQPTPNAGGTADSVLDGVACSSDSTCIAVGKSTSGLLSQALIERWNGVDWQIQAAASPPDASGSALTAVACTSSTACTAVGSFAAKSTKAGGTLAERWDGTTWTVVPTQGQTLDVLTAVACTTANACTAVGQQGFDASIVERWDGTSWVIEDSPNPSGASQRKFAGVACPTLTACLGVGSALYATGSGTTLTVAERWDGAQWTIQRSFNPGGATEQSLSGVSCATTRACMAVGYYFDADGTTLTLAERWDGSSWRIESTPRLAGSTGGNLGAVACPTERDCTAVGSYGDNLGNRLTLIEHWNGNTWRVQSSPNPAASTGSFLTGVSCAQGDCTAVGGGYDSAGAATTLVEHSTGAGWVIQPTPNPSDAVYVAFTGVSCPAAHDCTAVGTYVAAPFNFLSFAEHWNGTDWVIQVTPNPVGTDGPNANLEGGVACATKRACTAVGQWNPAPAPHPGVSLAEHWNGATWEVQTTANPPAVEGPNGTQNSPLEGVSCPTANDCMAVGNYDSGAAGGAFPTTAERWNGTRWSVQQTATPIGAYYSLLDGVSCPTPHTCMAVGNSTRINAQTTTRGHTIALVERYVSGDADSSDTHMPGE